MKNLVPGMMSWAGGTPGHTCRECVEFNSPGYYAGGQKGGGLKPGKCKAYERYMGKPGKAFPHNTQACLHFNPSDGPPKPFAENHRW